MKKFLIINGPNLNMLHKRDSEIYSKTSLEEIEKQCQDYALEKKFHLAFFQSNSESEIIDEIHKAINVFDGLIINAGAYTHTSIAIRDALEIFSKPKIELHLSNIYKREEFRHNSFMSQVVDGVICGFGASGYKIALSTFLT